MHAHVTPAITLLQLKWNWVDCRKFLDTFIDVSQLVGKVEGSASMWRSKGGIRRSGCGGSESFEPIFHPLHSNLVQEWSEPQISERKSLAEEKDVCNLQGPGASEEDVRVYILCCGSDMLLCDVGFCVKCASESSSSSEKKKVWGKKIVFIIINLVTNIITAAMATTTTLGMAIRMPSSVRACSSVDDDPIHLQRAAELAKSSAGLTAPHPNLGCVIARGPRIVGEGFLYAQGTKSAEVQAVERAGESARGATAYLNLEPGDCGGDDSAITALAQVGCLFLCFLRSLFLYFFFLCLLGWLERCVFVEKIECFMCVEDGLGFGLKPSWVIGNLTILILVFYVCSWWYCLKPPWVIGRMCIYVWNPWIFCVCWWWWWCWWLTRVLVFAIAGTIGTRCGGNASSTLAFSGQSNQRLARHGCEGWCRWRGVEERGGCYCGIYLMFFIMPTSSWNLRDLYTSNCARIWILVPTNCPVCTISLYCKALHVCCWYILVNLCLLFSRFLWDQLSYVRCVLLVLVTCIGASPLFSWCNSPQLCY